MDEPEEAVLLDERLPQLLPQFFAELLPGRLQPVDSDESGSGQGGKIRHFHEHHGGDGSGAFPFGRRLAGLQQEQAGEKTLENNLHDDVLRNKLSHLRLLHGHDVRAEPHGRQQRAVFNDFLQSARQGLLVLHHRQLHQPLLP